MLNKGKRVTTNEIEDIKGKWNTVFSPYLSVSTTKRNSTTSFVIVISKKVEKSAVKRNKLRRRIREILKISVLPHNAIVMVYVKKKIMQLSFFRIKEEIKNILKDIK